MVAVFVVFFVMQGQDDGERVIVQQVPPPQDGSATGRGATWTDILNNLVTTGGAVAQSWGKPAATTGGKNDLLQPKL